ncbi:hypothetical protein RJT34_29676 [Clitoria ternatea]|uniref:Uncharacterized protein n=1 Tax=Clitoria ternatea TaxID=43366 RepID=A0AAN9ERP3_CLITE
MCMLLEIILVSKLKDAKYTTHNEGYIKVQCCTAMCRVLVFVSAGRTHASATKCISFVVCLKNETFLVSPAEVVLNRLVLSAVE